MYERARASLVPLSSEWPRREGLLRVRWHRERNRVVESLFLSASNRKRDSRHGRAGRLGKIYIYIYIRRTYAMTGTHVSRITEKITDLVSFFSFVLFSILRVRFVSSESRWSWMARDLIPRGEFNSSKISANIRIASSKWTDVLKARESNREHPSLLPRPRDGSLENKRGWSPRIEEQNLNGLSPILIRKSCARINIARSRRAAGNETERDKGRRGFENEPDTPRLLASSREPKLSSPIRVPVRLLPFSCDALLSLRWPLG